MHTTLHFIDYCSFATLITPAFARTTSTIITIDIIIFTIIVPKLLYLILLLLLILFTWSCQCLLRGEGIVLLCGRDEAWKAGCNVASESDGEDENGKDRRIAYR